MRSERLATERDAGQRRTRRAAEGQHLLARRTRHHDQRLARCRFVGAERRRDEAVGGRRHAQERQPRVAVEAHDAGRQPRVLGIVELHEEPLVVGALHFLHELAPRHDQATGVDDDARTAALDDERAAVAVDLDGDPDDAAAHTGDDRRRASPPCLRGRLVGRGLQQGRIDDALGGQGQAGRECDQGHHRARTHAARLSQPRGLWQRHLPFCSAITLALASARLWASSSMRFWCLR